MVGKECLQKVNEASPLEVVRTNEPQILARSARSGFCVDAQNHKLQLQILVLVIASFLDEKPNFQLWNISNACMLIYEINFEFC